VIICNCFLCCDDIVLQLCCIFIEMFVFKDTTSPSSRHTRKSSDPLNRDRKGSDPPPRVDHMSMSRGFGNTQKFVLFSFVYKIHRFWFYEFGSDFSRHCFFWRLCSVGKQERSGPELGRGIKTKKKKKIVLFFLFV
jgi:hypothetical protein